MGTIDASAGRRSEPMQSARAETTWVAVWDPVVRVTHWVLVATFAIAWVSEDALGVHVWAGYLLAATLALRIVWGFIGPRRARFADFLYSPRTVLAYLRDLLRRRGPRYLGHSPAGGVMIVLLMLGLTGISVTGLALYAVEENAGPLAQWVGAGAPADGAARVADDEDFARATMGEDEVDGADADSEYWEELHETFVNFTLLLIALHVAGVAWASAMHHENLVRAMFTGRKRAQ